MIERRLPALFLSLFTASTASCGGESSQPDGGISPEVDAALSRFDASAVDSLPDLTGTWALREKVAALAALPIVGVVDSSTYSFRLVVLTSDGSGYESLETLCSMEMDTGTALATNEFSSEYIATRTPKTYGIEVMEPASFAREAKLLVEGATLSDPENDALPTTDDDKRVIDEDGDGNPGFTLDVLVTGLGSAQLYMVQRSQISMVGTVESADRISGSVELERFESVVIGSTNALFEPPEPPTPNSAQSNFVLARIADGSDCDDLLAADEAVLFGPR